MAAWFDDYPLNFSRDDTRSVELLILGAYPTNADLLWLGENAGLDLAALDQAARPKLLVREMLKKARLSDRLRGLVDQVFADPDVAGIHERLRALNSGDYAAARSETLHHNPTVDTLAVLPPTFSAWGPTDAAPVPLPPTGFERTTDIMSGLYLDPVRFRRGIAEAEVRTAQIEFGGMPSATGFLIGPDLLITAGHAIENRVDSGLARFDYTGGHEDGRAVEFAADYLVAHSPHDTEAKEFGPDGPAEGMWDFALIRLSEPVGHQAIGPDPSNLKADRRGFYLLEWDKYEFDRTETLLIMGHALGGAKQLSYASPASARLTAGRNRVRYRVNTLHGVDGAPVFNRDFRVVAVHQTSSPSLAVGPEAFGQGIPIAGIGSVLRTQLAGKPELAVLGLA